MVESKVLSDLPHHVVSESLRYRGRSF